MRYIAIAVFGVSLLGIQFAAISADTNVSVPNQSFDSGAAPPRQHTAIRPQNTSLDDLTDDDRVTPGDPKGEINPQSVPRSREQRNRERALGITRQTDGPRSGLQPYPNNGRTTGPNTGTNNQPMFNNKAGELHHQVNEIPQSQPPH